MRQFGAGQSFDPYQQQRQQAADDPRIAGTLEAPLAVLLLGHQPDLAFAAMNTIGFGLFLFAQGRQTLAPLHQQPCALFPAGRLFEDIQGFLCGHRQAHRSNSRA
ncbi:hypothetical protein D3C80_1037640 [compost metagenome]